LAQDGEACPVNPGFAEGGRCAPSGRARLSRDDSSSGKTLTGKRCPRIFRLTGAAPLDSPLPKYDESSSRRFFRKRQSRLLISPMKQ